MADVFARGGTPKERTGRLEIEKVFIRSPHSTLDDSRQMTQVRCPKGRKRVFKPKLGTPQETLKDAAKLFEKHNRVGNNG